VLEEVGILGGQHGLNQHLGKLSVGHHGPVLRADLAYQVALAIEHACDLRGMVVTDTVQAGQTGIVTKVVEHGQERGGAQQKRGEQQEQPPHDTHPPRPPAPTPPCAPAPRPPFPPNTLGPSL